VTDLLTVDRLDVLVLVDNVTDSLSTNPKTAVSEWTGLLTGGRLPLLSGRATCCAHHGLSLLITAHVGTTKRTLLFDAGPEAATFLRNVEVLGADVSAVESVVLSHGHWDHAGGLVAAIDVISRARHPHRVDCLVHPGMFAERGMQRPNGEILKFESVPGPDALTSAGANVINTRELQVIGDGVFYVSGEVPRVTSYEAGFPGHVRRSADGQSWEPDPLILDERFVSVNIKDKGQFVFSACSHAGLVNVLTHAASVFPSVPLYGVMGGLHLSGATEKIIPETVADLKQFDLKLLAPGHCTGWRALSAMARVFGDELVPSAVGKRYVI
jgi:7,8-dihydropterin-6-yl-methyl-4-(beta-D-ribofuranosyl)aminobenzene 5'-phosphate synthase